MKIAASETASEDSSEYLHRRGKGRVSMYEVLGDKCKQEHILAEGCPWSQEVGVSNDFSAIIGMRRCEKLDS